MSNAMSLKAKIRNIAKKKNIPAQVILQNYMFERLLVRLSVSDYREKFVLKIGCGVINLPFKSRRFIILLITHSPGFSSSS